MNQITTIYNQIQIAKAAIATAEELLQSLQPEEEAEEEENIEMIPVEECNHPDKYRKTYKTMGGGGWHCKKCGYIHEEVT